MSSRTVSTSYSVIIPSSPLDLCRVSYDKCMALLQSRPGPVQADNGLDPSHIQASVLMNNISDAAITGHTLGRFGIAANCKNGSMPGPTLGCASVVRHARARCTHLSHERCTPPRHTQARVL